MCFILTVLFVIATYVFYTKALMAQAIGSGVIAAIALFFLIRKLIKNGRCIFGGERDC
jgi:multisubunit Na+/H+ antiporter MnhC subunit